jgi:hypothetical protein
MAFISVAIVQQRVWLPQQLRASLMVGSALMMAACGGTSQAPSAPSASNGGGPATAAFTVGGRVTWGSRPLSEVAIELQGGAIRYQTRSNADGTYRFSLVEPGEYVLRASAPGYATAEQQIAVNSDLTRDFSLTSTSASSPPPPPYTFVGTVKDSRGNPVVDAEVWLYSNSSPIEDRRATGRTDGAGRYSFTIDRGAHTVRAMKDAYVTNDVRIVWPTPPISTTVVTDVTVRRIDRFVLVAPPTIEIGQIVKVGTRVDLDDATAQSGIAFGLSSSNPAVLSVLGGGDVRGMAAGNATLTAAYYGVTGRLQVRVEP